MENFDVHSFIVCVFNVDKHNIIMIDVPRTHMYITSWAFLSVFEMDFINTRYIKLYDQSMFRQRNLRYLILKYQLHL